MSAKNIADNAKTFFLTKKDVVKKTVDEVVRPGLEAKVEEIRAKALEIFKPAVEHHAEAEFTPIWKAFYNDAAEVAEESLIATIRSLFLDANKNDAEMAVLLASQPQSNTISLASFISLLKSLGPIPRLFSLTYQLLELPFCLHVTSLEAVCLLQGQPVGTFLLRRRAGEASFTICYVEATNVVREVGFAWHEKEEGLLCPALYSIEPNQVANPPFAMLQNLTGSYPTSLKAPFKADFLFESWYHGLLTKATAMERLEDQPAGSFVCYLSEAQNTLVVSAVMANGVQHFELRVQPRSGFKDAAGTLFETVTEYIQKTVPNSRPVKRTDHLRFLTLRRLVLQRPMQRHHTLSELHYLIDKLGSTPSHNTAVLRVMVLGSHPVAVRHLAQAWHVDATINAAGLTAQGLYRKKSDSKLAYSRSPREHSPAPHQHLVMMSRSSGGLTGSSSSIPSHSPSGSINTSNISNSMPALNPALMHSNSGHSMSTLLGSPISPRRTDTPPPAHPPVLSAVEVTDVSSAIAQLQHLIEAWRTAAISSAQSQQVPSHILPISTRLELRQHNFSLLNIVHSLKQLLSVNDTSIDAAAIHDQAVRVAGVATELNSVLGPLVRHFEAAFTAMLGHIYALLCGMETRLQRPSPEASAQLSTTLQQLEDALSIGPILSLGSRDRWRSVVQTVGGARVALARIAASPEPLIHDICNEFTDTVEEVRACFEGISATVVNFVALPVQDILSTVEKARQLPHNSRRRAMALITSARSMFVPALDSVDLLDFIAHTSQVVVKHSGVVLSETLAHSDLRPVELFDSSGVDKKFLQNFLMKHIHGLLYLADERATAADVIEAKVQAIEARKDPSLPFVLAKVKTAPIPPAVLQDLKQFGVEPGQQPAPIPDWDVFEVGSVNALLAPIIAKANDDLHAKLFLKELISEKQGKLELNLGRYAQPERIKHARFQDGLYSVILAHNQLTALPPHLVHDLRNLHSLRLDDNKLTEFPIELASLSLARLKLGDNQIPSIPHEIKLFTSLVELDISNNALNFLPPELGSLSKLKSLNLTGNPLESVPPEKLKGGTENILLFLRQLTEPTVKWKRLKLLFVGEENVGKTSLLSCFNPKKGGQVPKKGAPHENLSTNGVDINSFDLDKEVQFSAWDFGGQEIFYPTHQFFLSDRAFYLLCFSLARPSVQRIEYWLKQIRAVRRQLPGPSVFLVGTHADRVSKDVAKELLERYAYTYKQYGVKGTFSVSCTERTGIKELAQALKAEAVKQKLLNQPIPGSWGILTDFIVKEKEKAKTPYWYWEEFKRIAMECSVVEAQGQTVAEFLNDVGILVYFSQMRTTFRDLVVLDPQFLADVMSGVVTFAHTLIKNGVLQHKDLPQVWGRFPPELHQSLLELLENFEIAHRLQKANPPASLVPCLLSDERPSVSAAGWEPTLPFGTVQYGRTYDFSFLPLGFVGRLLTRLLHIPLLEARLLWKHGMLMSYGRYLGLLSYNPDELVLKVLVRVQPALQNSVRVPRPLLLQIVENIDTLLAAYPSYEPKKRIPCSHCFSLRNPLAEIYEFPFSECVNAITSGHALVYCRGVPSRGVRLDFIAPDLSFGNIPRLDDVTLGDKLGEGGFGIVWKGALKDGTQVAVKELKVPSSGLTAEERQEKFQEFQREVYIMSNLEHPNIVNLYGIMIDPLRMVMELIQGGDLYHFLHPKGSEPLPKDAPFYNARLRLRIAYDIALGMMYLQKPQSVTPPIIHRDLRSPNIYLVTHDDHAPVVAKVADFGLAERVAATVVGQLQTWRWAAPETFDAQCQTYDERADNYSYGIVVWEIASAERPFEEYESEGDDFALKRRIINENLRPMPPKDCNPVLASVMTGAWHHQASQRLPFSAAAVQLAQALDMAVPPDGGARMPTHIQFKNDKPSLSGRAQSESVAVSATTPTLFKFARRVPTVDSGGVMAMLAVRSQVWMATSKGSISVWSSAGPVIGVLSTAHEGRVHALISVGKSVMSAGEDGKIHVWSTSPPFDKRATLARHTQMIRAMIAVSGDAGYGLAVWSGDVEGKVLVWNPAQLTDATIPKGLTQQQAEGLSAMCQVEQQVWLATRKCVLIYDLASSQVLKTVSCEFPLTRLVCIPRVAVWGASNQTSIPVFSLQGEKVASLPGHTAKIISLYYWPGRNLVLSGSFDTTALLWNPSERRCLEELKGHHRDAVRSMLAVRDDTTGKETLWTGGDDKDASFCVYELPSTPSSP